MTAEIAEGYRRFALHEARGASPLYEALALHVAGSAIAKTFLSALSPEKRQPNLLFAATRHVAGTPEGPAHFDQLILERGVEIADVMQCRTTQTNEPGRCAVLLPVLAQIDGPIALIEVGASAGLCLLPDHYGYRYGERVIDPPDAMRDIAPSLVCAASDNTPIPMSLPQIVWRAGIDLNPLDVDRAEDVNWLEILVWPEQTARLERLRAAIQVAKRLKPTVVRGDLRSDLSDLLDQAPKAATVVVFHTAVLTYLPSNHDRDAFARSVQRAGAVWISNESPRVLPQFAKKAPVPSRSGMFLMMRDAQPVAWTGPHGQAIAWLASK